MSRHLSLKDLIASAAVIPAISYGRVSSTKQLNGEGLRRQRSGTLGWIDKHPELHIRLDAEKEDQARSAWKGDHVRTGSALGAILEQVKSGELKPPLLLIVEALDRLSRQEPTVAQEQFVSLINRGILIATTKDDKIYGPGMDLGELILSIVFMAGAHAASESTSQRVRATKLQHVQDAMISKAVLHQNCPNWMVVREKISPSNRATRSYDLLPGPAATVQVIYELGLHHGSDYITRKLIDDGVPAFGRTGQWSLRTVKKILRSRAPVGHLQSKHGIIEGEYPRVVSDDLWLRVQAAQDQRRETGSKTPWQSKHVNLFVGIGVCASCGGKMRLTPQKGRQYYGCRNHALLHTCDNRHRYRQDIIEAAMLDRFGLGWLETHVAGEKVDVAGLSANLDKLRERKARLAGKLKQLDDDQMFDVVMSQLRELEAEVNDASTKLHAARQQSAVAAPMRINTVTDRAELATALRQRLTAVRFGTGNLVEIESHSHVLSVVAREGVTTKPTLVTTYAPTPDLRWRSNRKNVRQAEGHHQYR